MSSEYNKTVELLKQLINSKKNLANTLTDKGEEASFNEPFDTLVDKAANYTPKTYILVDGEGNEMVGTLVDTETTFDATENDIREGKTAATDKGVTLGTKVIPVYNTSEGYIAVPPKSAFAIKSLIKGDLYDFTKLQAVICKYNGSIANSVAVDKISIEGKVYAVNSTEVLSTVIKDKDKKQIDFALINDSNIPYVLRYITFKEIY